jgi:hypothetical protein
MSSKPMHSTSGLDATAVGMHTPTRPLPEVFAMPQSPADEIRHKLLGAWSLVSWESFSDHGTQSYPLGEDAVGQLMYDDTGSVSAQLVRLNQQRFQSDDWRQARPDEMCAAWLNYFGYFGTFTIDTDNDTVTHHIESGWFPNLIGTGQIRHYRFDGDDRLVLDADTAWDNVRIVWQRIKPTIA